MSEERTPTPVDIYYLIAIITQFIICLLGLLMNTFLAMTIFKNKTLHTTCGYLLLALAIYDGLAEFSQIHVLTFPVLFNVTIPLLYCFLFSIWNSYFIMAANFLIMFISFDRLMAVSMPFQYKYILNIRSFARLYVGSIVYITLILALHVPILVWIHTVSLRPNLQVYCLATDYIDLEKPAFKYGSLVLIVTMCASLIVYIIICWLILIAIKAEKLQNIAERKIHKALFILMGIILFCWILPYAIQLLLLPALHNSPALVLVINRFLTLLGRAAQAMNAPILYLSSSEYRKAMQKCIGLKSANSIVGHHLNLNNVAIKSQPQSTVMQNNFVQH